MTSAARRVPAAVLAVGAQASQGLSAFLILAVAARTLELGTLGTLSILYGLLVFSAALTTGFVGDSLTVLDRSRNGVRSGLLAWFVVLTAGSALTIPSVLSTVGLIDLPEAALFAAAMATYLVKDLLRRLMMAHLRFGGIILMDLTVLPIAGAVLLLSHSGGSFGLGVFLLALSSGQLAGIIAGIGLLPQSERHLASLRGAQWRPVASFGFWRAAQQGLRPSLLTGLRTAVVLMLSLEAAGLLEIARIYAAPLMQIVAGVSAYLFASFARSRTHTTKALLRRADRGVAALLLTAVTGAGLALLLLPVAGPLVTGRTPSATAVAAWLAYAGATAAASPYGTLAAVRAGSRRVFLIRLVDTAVALLAGAAILAGGGAYELVPLAAAAVTLAGGLALRRFLLVPLVNAEAPAPGSGADSTEITLKARSS